MVATTNATSAFVVDRCTGHGKPTMNAESAFIVATNAMRFPPFIVSSVSREPVGAPFPVYHLHSARQTFSGAEIGGVLAISKDRAYFWLSESTSDVWLSRLSEQ